MFDTNIFIKNLYGRDLGALSPEAFIYSIFEKSLNSFEISKYSNSENLNASVTWFSLDTIEYK